MPSERARQVYDVCRDVISPMVAADGGELLIVALDDDSVAVHLAGMCAGCPGAPITSRSIIEPAIKSVSASIKVTVTAGHTAPAGACPVAEFAVD